MKIKKLLSLISAAAISASCFAGMAVTASAKSINGVVGTIYKANELCDRTNNNDLMEFDSSKDAAYSSIGSPFGAPSTFTVENYGTVAQGVDATADITYNIEKAGTYTFSMLVYEYNRRYPIVSLDGGVVLDGANLTGQTQYGNAGQGRTFTILQVTSNLTAGEHTYSWVPTSENRIQGLLAVVLNDTTPAPVTATVAATGETYTENEGPAAASFKTDAIDVNGALSNVFWTLTNAVSATAKVEVADTATVIDGTVIFGILISDIDEGVNIINASLTYTVE